MTDPAMTDAPAWVFDETERPCVRCGEPADRIAGWAHVAAVPLWICDGCREACA